MRCSSAFLLPIDKQEAEQRLVHQQAIEEEKQQLRFEAERKLQELREEVAVGRQKREAEVSSLDSPVLSFRILIIVFDWCILIIRTAGSLARTHLSVGKRGRGQSQRARS